MPSYSFPFVKRFIQMIDKAMFLSFLFIVMATSTGLLEAVYLPVYTTNANGGIAYTGNTLGLNKAANQNQPGISGSIGAFITTDTSSQVGSYPVGTTLNWTLNSSTAVLDLPTNSTVLHAELIWSGSYGFDPAISGAVLDTPVTFITPDAVSHVITPNPLTAQSRVNAGSNGFYVRSADVTTLVSAGGTYTVGGVPATVVATENNLNCAGWTLAVAYANPNMLTSNLTIFVSCEASGASPALVTGFHAPDLGTVSSRLFTSCLEGDAQLVGDHFLVGATPVLTYPADGLSGSNNPGNNYFGSQVNTVLVLTNDVLTGKLLGSGSSVLDTRGSFGSSNSNINTGTSISGARQGYDITSSDLGGIIINSQESVYAQGTTQGDVYTTNSVGLQIQVFAPVINSQKSVSPIIGLLNDVLTYTLTFTNVGEALASSLILTDNLPVGLAFVPNSLTVNGVPVIGADIVAGVPLGDLSVNGTVTVVFQATITQANPPSSYDNRAVIQYMFTPLNSPLGPATLYSSTNVSTVTTPAIAPPIANPDVGSMNANSVFNGTSVLANDVGSSLSISVYDPVSVNLATIFMQSNGTFTYTPPVGYSGVDTFTYTAVDSIGQTATATVTITVFPLAFGNSGTVAANTQLNQTISVLDNDVGTSLVVSSFDATSVNGASISMLPNGTYTYNPAANFSGLDTFNYTLTDAAGNTAVGVVSILVLPAAANDIGVTPANTLLNGSTVFTNDVGTGLTLIAYQSVSNQNGQVVMNMLDGTYTYTPPLNFSGTDTFTYTVQDQLGSITFATVTILVLPLAVNDSASVPANATFNQPISILSNDIGTGLSVSSYSVLSVQGATVVVQPDGTYTYTPPMNYSGVDAFTYVASDQNNSQTSATVFITVLPLGAADTGITFANTTLIGSSVLLNDTGTALVVTSFQATSDNGGMVTMNLDGTYTYVPPLNFSGLDTFTYTATDSTGGSFTNTVTITVLPTGGDNFFSTLANTILVGSSVLADDAGTGLTVTGYQNVSAQGGSILMNPDGTFTYAPPFNFSGTDTFSYTATDSSGNSFTQVVTITVLPTGADSAFTTPVNTPLNGSSVLINDSGSGLSVTSFESVSSQGGTVAMNPDGIFFYRPPTNFIGIDTFTYTGTDSSGNSFTAKVVIQVTPLLAPTNFLGDLKTNRFFDKTEYCLIMTWNASMSPSVVGYRIYYGNKLVKRFSANDCLIYKTTLHCKKDAARYSISAVDRLGVESNRVKLRIDNE